MLKPQPKYGWRGQESESYCKFAIGTEVQIGNTPGLIAVVLELEDPLPKGYKKDWVHAKVIASNDRLYGVGYISHWNEWQLTEIKYA